MRKFENLTIKANICLTPEDMAKLKELTDAKNTDSSKLMRKLIRDEYQKQLQKEMLK